MEGRQAWTKEKELALKAVALDPNLPEAHLSLGIALVSAFDWQGGEREIKRSLELNPNLVLGLDQYAWFLAARGRLDEAIATGKKAVESDPLSALVNGDLGFWYYLSRRYDDSISQCLKTLELEPSYAFGRTALAASLLCKGEVAAAISELQEAKRIDDLPNTDAQLGYAYAVSGNRGKAESVIHELNAQARKGKFVSAGAMASIYLGLGDKQEALEWLAKAYEEQDVACWYLNVDPLYDSLRNEPRFQALLHKVGLDK